MKFLYNLFPLLLFFAAFKIYDIYVATVVAIVASALQVIFYWLKHRRFETIHVVTLAILVVFGGLTLALHDDTFIKWKPTLVYWILGALILGSQWIGKQTAVERLLGKQVIMPSHVWARQNLSWGTFFVVIGFLNIYVAFYYRPELDEATRQDIWVDFKVFALPALTLVFTLLQGALMARHVVEKPDDNRPPNV